MLPFIFFFAFLIPAYGMFVFAGWPGLAIVSGILILLAGDGHIPIRRQ